MTDQEIIVALKAATEIQKQFRDLVKPVAEELAKRASKEIKRDYDGQIGCYDMGNNVICSHNNGTWPPRNKKEKHDKIDDIEERINKLFRDNNLGFYYQVMG